MISKVITGSGFYGTCRYICGNEQRSTVIAAEGVRDYSYKLMAHDFEAQRQMRREAWAPADPLGAQYTRRFQIMLLRVGQHIANHLLCALGGIIAGIGGYHHSKSPLTKSRKLTVPIFLIFHKK